MDLKKIGCFLKELRKEKGVTQEQMAEIFGVSGRTVSRWETGTNMPDLSILIPIAEYYDVDVKEILNGERKSECMNDELKETLLKVADYSELEKKRALKAGNAAFLLMFGICITAIVIQMLTEVELKGVLGETAAVMTGGISYIMLMVHYGIWEINFKTKNTILRDGLISVICAGVFSIIYAVCVLKMGAENVQAMRMAVVFFFGISIIGFGVLRLLACMSKRQESQNRSN